MMNQRPPALMTAGADQDPVIEEEEEDSGLQIDGLNLDKAPSSEGGSFVDAKVDLGNELQSTDRPQSNPPMSNHLGEIDTGHPSLLPSPLAKTDSQ
jgi:hypothetical protein